MVLINRKGEVLSRVVSDLPVGSGIYYALKIMILLMLLIRRRSLIQ